MYLNMTHKINIFLKSCLDMNYKNLYFLCLCPMPYGGSMAPQCNLIIGRTPPPPLLRVKILSDIML